MGLIKHLKLEYQGEIRKESNILPSFENLINLFKAKFDALKSLN